MSIGFVAGGGSPGIQRKENSKQNPTTQTVDSVVRPIIDFLIDKARNASIAKLALSWDKPADLALISAAKNGELEKVQEILNQKEHGYVSIGVAIRKAAINGHLDIVRKLLASDIGETLFYGNEENIRENFPDAPKDIKEVFSRDCLDAIGMIFTQRKDLNQKNYTEIIKMLARISPDGFGKVILRADRIEDKKLRQQFLENFCDEKHFDIEKLMSACLNEGADSYRPDVLRILGKFSGDMPVRALVVAANSGRSYLFKEILGDLKVKDFGRFDFQDILVAMIKGDLRELVFSFLDEVEDPAEKKELIRFAFQTAVQSGQLPVLEELFKKYEIDSLHIKVAIFHAAKIGNTEFAMLLIKKLEEREDLEFFNPEGTLIHALANGMVELTQKLSPEFIEISKPLLQKALECASKNKIYRPQVIEELLTKWKELPAENTDFFESRDQGFELVIRAAIENNNQSLIEQLLKLQLPIHSENFRGILVNACSQAMQNGHTEIIERLLQNGQIIKEARGRAVSEAALNGHTMIIRRLLEIGPISEEHRNNALYNAAKGGHVEVIDMLLQNGRISDEARGCALEYAARYGHPRVIERLLQDGARIPLHYLNEAVFLLAEVGLDLPVLNALVVNAPLANHYEDGINVHAGSRDDKTRAALELLWKHTDAGKIEEHFRSCISYLQVLPESGKKTLALKALYGPKGVFPPLLDEERFSCNGFSLTGKELIGRLWGFISGCDKNNQHECKEGMVTALSTSFDEHGLVCNQGKTQRLLIAVLQGRLEGVQIDDLAPVLSPDQAFALFFRVERRQLINKKEDLLAEANSFLEDNPSVQRESFMAKLEDYWNLRDEDQEEAVQGGAVQEEAVQEEAVQGGDDLE